MERIKILDTLRCFSRIQGIFYVSFKRANIEQFLKEYPEE